MADLKTTNIYGDAYINNKVGIATNAPATRLQIGQLSPTAATEGIQFGDDTSTRIYRIGAGSLILSSSISTVGTITSTYGTFSAPGISIGDGQYGFYITSGNLTYKSAAGGAHYWRNIANSANTLTLDNSGNLTATGTITGANLSGTNTGDQSIGNGTITIAAGTGVGVGSSNTFTTNQSGATTVTITNTGVTSNVAGTGISVSGATGAVTITNGGVTSLAGTTNRITVSGATGAVTLNLPQDIHTSASPTFSGLSLTSVSTTGATITNLTGAYQNTTVYDSPRTQSATPTRGIRAPASSIQFTDSYAIAPFYTYRSTGDWPVPYGIGWGTGGESSGIFQRYASNGSSFGDMIFYTGNDGFGAFSFRRHTWEGTTYFAAGSGELNTELFRVDWSGKATATSFALPGGFTITDPGSGYAAFSNWVLLGTTGFYSSTNSAHLSPNLGTYGSWKITGTRNGWHGIEFESGTILMANSSESGFYRVGSGWQMWWSGGTGYVQKGGSGGGTQATILESSNYTSYAPGLGTNNTLTGINTIYNTSNTVINNQSGNLGLTMFQATAGTDAYMTFHIGSDFAAYFGLGGAENDLVYGGWSAGNNRHRILHSGNAPYAWNMNQYVRTTDSPTFNTVTANITGNAYNNLSNDYKDIYVYGDVNTYYVVLIQGEYLYSFGRYSVTRGYNWTGPDTWNTASHKGGLTLDWEWSGDIAWGGNDKAIRIIEFNESYSTMVAGLGYPVNGGVIIWLRGGGGGGAQYRIRTPNGSNSVVTVYDGLSIANHVASTTFTAADSTVFSTRANTNNVSAEILARYPVRATGGLFDGNNAVLHAGNYNSYSPTLTGTGASGTWGISVTGNAGGSAASCTGNAATTTILQTARNINGTSFNGSAAITTATWGTARTLTIGSTGKSVDGSAAITWSLAEIGAAATNQTMFIGTTSVAINRASANLALTGITSIDGNAATATTTDNINGRAFYNRDSGNPLAQDSYTNNGIGYVNAVSLFSQTDGGMYASAYSTSWVHQIYGDFRTGQIAIRGKNNGTWQAFRTVLDSSNYTSFAPSLTGTGASGTWSINVTGNASGTAGSISGFNNPTTAATANTIVYRDVSGNFSAGTITATLSGTATTATTAVSATSATSATSLNSSNSIARTGTSGNYNTDFQNTPAGTVRHQGDDSSATNNPGGTWWFVDNYRHSNASNYWGTQVAWGWEDNANRLATRNVIGGTFGGWVYYLNSANYNSYSPTLTGTGASGTWAINITGNATTATTATGNAGSVTYLPGRTDATAYPVLWGAAYTNAVGTIAYSCAAVTIQSSTGILSATSFSGAGTGLSGTATSLSIGGNAVTAGGLSVHGGTNNEANKIVRTDGNGYINAGWINTPSGDMPDTQSINRIYCSDDQYIRYKGVADFKQQIGLTYKNATPRSSNTTDPNYWTGIMGWVGTDWNSMADWGCGFVDSWDSPANRPPVGGHHVGIQALHYTNGSARYGWQMANGGANNRWWLRDVWGGSFSTWFEILTSTNYTSFAPSLTGTGASGTWAINITGNATTATTATNVTIANGSVTLAKIENITAYTILGNSNASSAATPAALSVATVATMLSGQTMNINGSSTSCSGNAATATVNSGNTSAAWYPIVWHSGNTHYSSTGTIIYAAGNYIQANYFNSSDDDTGNITRFVVKNGDGYHRSATTTLAADVIRGVASGTWSITAATANALTTGNTYQVANIGIGVAASNKLHISGDGTNPPIRIDNPALGSGTSSSRGFYGWLPISIGGAGTKYIQLYN